MNHFKTLPQQIQYDKTRGMPASKVSSILKGEHPVIQLQDIITYPNVEDLVGNGIVLYIPEDSTMQGHYVCLFIRNGNELNWWDSYAMGLGGLEYSAWLNTTHDGLFVKRYLYNLLESWKARNNKVIFNMKQVQKLNNQIADCGRHASCRLLYKHLDNDEYLRFMRYKNIDMDDLVTLLTFLAD